MGSKLRRVYDAAQTPLERVLACAHQAKKEQVAELKDLRESLDPFQLGKVIDQKLKRIYEMANRRLSPKAMQESRATHTTEKAQRSRRNGYGKDARMRELGNRFAIPTFPQPRRRRASGYISNVSTG